MARRGSSTMSDEDDDESSTNSSLLAMEDSQQQQRPQQQQQQDDEEDHQQQQPPRPRDHSYLAGTAHPLFSSPLQPTTNGSSVGNNINDTGLSRSSHQLTPSIQRTPQSKELAILELPGVVLFPGSIIPVRLRHPHLIAYLGQQIDLCRNHPDLQPQVQLGILTFQEDTEEEQAIRRGRGNTGSARHPCIGRIGTIATIQYTQERSVSISSEQIWQQYQRSNELVFTALGTGRFQVLAPVSFGDEHVFQVRELQDEPLTLPSMSIPRRFFLAASSEEEENKADTDMTSLAPSSKDGVSLTKTKTSLHRNFVRNLSTVTPIPHFLLQRNWPWLIVEELAGLLKELENHPSSNCPSLESAPGDIQKSPTKFSYWMSSNMPFTHTERLELLRMDCTLERLHFLREKTNTLVQNKTVHYWGCARCRFPVSKVSDVFQYVGAEGTTSAYVNEHGYIHQVITLRHVISEDFLYYAGRPCTDNSYFPGYSWLITYCGRCGELLGWKFQRVGRSSSSTRPQSDPANKNCPDHFFGFQSSSLVRLGNSVPV
eukprot:Nitzschia sp. Nitz4//scaffold49_size126201//16706//18505//NITZ4_003629-RA/size126201-augustus-gene-0.7-mRNA-1//-1//CDS//3329553110//3632//frame0